MEIIFSSLRTHKNSLPTKEEKRIPNCTSSLFRCSPGAKRPHSIKIIHYFCWIDSIFFNQQKGPKQNELGTHYRFYIA